MGEENSPQVAQQAFFQISPPSEYDFSRPEEWPLWLSRFERFRHASGLDKQSPEKQVNTLLYSMGPEAESIVRCRNLSEAQLKDYDVVKTELTNHFIPKRNLIFERARFHKRVQESGESMDSFIKALYDLIQHCEYGDLKEELIRDRLVVGLRDQALSEKLQLDEKLTLDTAKRTCLRHESIKKQTCLLKGEVHPEQSVEAVTKKNTARPPTSQLYRTPTTAPSPARPQQKNCGWCGRSPHSRQACPAKDATCRSCQRRGHFAAVCRSNPVVTAEVQDGAAEVAGDVLFLGSIGDGQEQPWVTHIGLCGHSTKFKIDTGADVTVIPECLYQDLYAPPPLEKTTKFSRAPAAPHSTYAEGFQPP